MTTRITAKLCFVLGLATLWLSLPISASADRLIDRLAAVIDARPVTLYDVQRTQSEPDLRPLMMGLPPGLPHKRDPAWALDQTIIDDLEIQSAHDLGVAADAKAARARIDELQRQNGWSGPELKRAMRELGFGSVKAAQRAFQRAMSIAQIVRIKVGGRVSVSEKEVAEQFRRTHGDGMEDEVHLRQILIRVPLIVRPAVEADLARYISDIHGAIERGEIEFETAARKYSESPERDDGGDLGWTRRGVYQFDKDAFDLNPGKISPVIRSFLGFHILKVDARRRVKLENADRLKRAITEAMYTERFLRAQDKWSQDLRGHAVVRIFDDPLMVGRQASVPDTRSNM